MAGLSRNIVRGCVVSDAALSRVLAAIKAQPELLEKASTVVKTNRKRLGNSTSATYREVSTTIELPTQTVPFCWQIPRSSKLLGFYVDKCPGFKDLVSATLLTHPLPWHVVLYVDELVPGNVLRPDNSRKSYIWYWSFMEFESHLRQEFVWLVAGVLRHSILNSYILSITAKQDTFF